MYNIKEIKECKNKILGNISRYDSFKSFFLEEYHDLNERNLLKLEIEKLVQEHIDDCIFSEITKSYINTDDDSLIQDIYDDLIGIEYGLDIRDLLLEYYDLSGDEIDSLTKEQWALIYVDRNHVFIVGDRIFVEYE